MRRGGGEPEAGQMAILGAGAILAFTLIAAAIYDVGQVVTLRRALQNSADAAVLAGVQELDCTNNATLIASARAVAADYAGKNVSNLEPPDINADATTVRARVTREANGLLADFLNFDVQATARAEAVCTTEGGAAIFAGSPSCDPPAVIISGGNDQINGTVHSNGGVSVSGSSNAFGGAVEYGEQCDASDAEINSGQDPPVPVPQPVPTQGYPIPEAPLAALLNNNNMDNCTFEWAGKADLVPGAPDDDGQAIWLDNSNANPVLQPGTYCAGGDIVLSRQFTDGNVTFLAKGQIIVSASDANLTAFFNGVLLYSSRPASSGPAIDISGSRFSFAGALFGPNSLVKVAGQDNSTVLGSIVGYTVEISGSNMGFTGTFGSGNITKTYALVE